MPRERSWGIPQEVNLIMQVLSTCHRVFSECVGPGELRFEVLQSRTVGTIHFNDFAPVPPHGPKRTALDCGPIPVQRLEESSDQTHRMSPAWRPQALGWAVAQEKRGQRGFAYVGVSQVGAWLLGWCQHISKGRQEDSPHVNYKPNMASLWLPLTPRSAPSKVSSF